MMVLLRVDNDRWLFPFDWKRDWKRKRNRKDSLLRLHVSGNYSCYGSSFHDPLFTLGRDQGDLHQESRSHETYDGQRQDLLSCRHDDAYFLDVKMSDTQ